MWPGDEFELSPETIELSGCGTAVVDGRTVAVPDLFVGERARVAVTHVSKGGPKAAALPVELLEPSPYRRALLCPDHTDTRSGRCTGCPLMALTIEGQHAQKIAMLKHLGLSVSEIQEAPEELGYRYSSKRVAHGRRVLWLGSYVRGSHKVAEMSQCRVDHPKITEAANELVKLAKEMRVLSAEGADATGIRHALFVTNGAEVTVTIVVRETSQDVVELGRSLSVPSTVAISVNSGDGNSIRGQSVTVVQGKDDLEVRYGDYTVLAPALGFVQPNPQVAEKLYAHLISDEKNEPVRGKLAFDLYAGSGVTTRMLQEKFTEVLSSEKSVQSALALGVPPIGAADFLSSNSARRADLVVANPPRKGLTTKVTGALLEAAPKRIHIMSCGPKGLERDLRELSTAYELESLQAFDTLPQTPHVELIAKLVRRAP